MASKDNEKIQGGNNTSDPLPVREQKNVESCNDPGYVHSANVERPSRQELDAMSTVAQMGSEVDEEEEEEAKGAKRRAEEAAAQAKKGKLQPEEDSCDKLMVRNLPAGVDEAALKDFFKTQEVDVESVHFVVGRTMCVIHLTKEMSASEVEKINGQVLDGNSLMADLFERKLKAPEADTDQKGAVEKTQEKTKGTKVTKQGQSVGLLSKGVETYLDKVLDFAEPLYQQPEMSFDLGVGIGRGVILVDDKESRDFGKKVEKHIKGRNIFVIGENTEKLDGDGVENIFRYMRLLRQPGIVLLRNIEAAAGNVSLAIRENLEFVVSRHLPIIIVGTTTLPDQVEKRLARRCSLRP